MELRHEDIIINIDRKLEYHHIKLIPYLLEMIDIICDGNLEHTMYFVDLLSELSEKMSKFCKERGK